MQPVTVERTVRASGVTSSAMFGISEGDEAHLFGILRSTLYTDKELAVLREYSANAWDAHVEAGKGDVPIKVLLPSALNPTLVVRDFGKGLSEEDIFRIYSRYGKSTKRESNSSVGYMGIGSKSAFCYSDSFTITSFHGGVRRVFSALIDETNVGKIVKIHEEPCGGETGIEIKVPVVQADCGSFTTAARHLYRYFEPRPDVNLGPEPEAKAKAEFDAEPLGEHGLVHPPRGHHASGKNGVWEAVMGCIPYRITLAKLGAELGALGLDEIADKLNGVLRFDIGEVSVAASREELEYTPRTRKAVAQRMKDLFDRLRKVVEAKAADLSLAPWLRRVAVREYASRYPVFGLSPDLEPLTEGTVFLHLDDDLTGAERRRDGRQVTVPANGPCAGRAETFHLRGHRPMDRYRHHHGSNRRSANHLPWGEVVVSGRTRILIKDVKHAVSAYPVRYQDHLAWPRERVNDQSAAAVGDAVEAEVRALVAAAGIDGIEVVRMSTLVPKRALPAPKGPKMPRAPRQPGRPKSRERVLVMRKYLDRRYWTRGNAGAWEPHAGSDPTPEDPYVVLDGANVRGFAKVDDFYDDIKLVRRAAEALDVAPPRVFAYRILTGGALSTVCVPYAEWRATWQTRVMNAKRLRLLEAARWFKHASSLFKNFGESFQEEIKAVIQALTPDHPVSEALFEVAAARKVLIEAKCLASDDQVGGGGLRKLVDLQKLALPDHAWRSDAALAKLQERYPLLHAYGYHALWGGSGALWVDYVRLVDQQGVAASCAA